MREALAAISGDERAIQQWRAFNAVLGENQRDWETRLVLADWLDEHGLTGLASDERATALAWRAIEEGDYQPIARRWGIKWRLAWMRKGGTKADEPQFDPEWGPLLCVIPGDWFDLLRGGYQVREYSWRNPRPARVYADEARAFNALNAAWKRLPEGTRA